MKELDMRIYESYRGSSKRMRFRQYLGTDAADGFFIDFLIGVRKERPKGILYDWNANDIAAEANWHGDPDVFLDALIRAGFLDKHNGEGTYSVHNWETRQEFACKEDKRKEKARMASKTRWDKVKKYKEIYAARKEKKQAKKQGLTIEQIREMNK